MSLNDATQVVDDAWTREVSHPWNDRPAFLGAEPHALRQGEQGSQPKLLHGVILQVRVHQCHKCQVKCVSKSSRICAKGQILKVATTATNPGVCGPENAKKKSAQELLGTEASGSFCEGFFSSSKSVRQHPGTPTHRKTLKQSSNGFSVTVSQEARSLRDSDRKSICVFRSPNTGHGPIVKGLRSKVSTRRMGHDAQVSWAC